MIEFSNGAKASAILYSLVETAKANMINTFEYFNLLLTEILQHIDDKDLRFIDDLLPWSPSVQKEIFDTQYSCLRIYLSSSTLFVHRKTPSSIANITVIILNISFSWELLRYPPFYDSCSRLSLKIY